MNILMTGSGGFIGKNLLHYISKNNLFPNDTLFFVKREKNNLFCLNSKQNIYSLSDIHPNVVVHLGAYTPKSGVDCNNINGSLSNVVFLNQLLSTFKSIPTKFIFISSLDVYEISTEPLSEHSNIIPISLYAHSKLFCEKTLEQWANQNNVVLQILRLGHIYGPGENEYQKLIPLTIRNIINNISPTIFNNGLERRAYLYIEDCCRLIVNAIHLEQFEGPINIVSENSVPIHQIVSSLVTIGGKRELSIINKINDAPIRDIVFDNRKMKKLLGLENVNLEEGLRSEFDYFASL